MVEIAPAILVYSSQELDARIASVPDAKTLHIDIMDGQFVNNKTIGPAELQNLPNDKEIEYHLMVQDPLAYIQALPGGANKIFEVHIESLQPGQEERIRALVQSKGSRLAFVLNPPTPVSEVEPRLQEVKHVLLMTVNPGWAGQSYIEAIEEKMRQLHERHPHLIIEIDGGVGPKTIPRASAAGANRFAAASSVFGQKDPNAALRELKSLARSSGEKHRQ